MAQQNGNNGHIFEFGKFVLDPNERILFADGEPVHLTDKVFDTLHLLVRHNGRLLSKEQMMSSIWEESFVEEGNLAKNISRLRKILNVDDARLIETIPRRGYRFAADVRELDGDTSLLIRRNLRVKITQTDEAEEKVRHLTGTRRRWSLLSVGIGAGLLVAAGLGFYFLKGNVAAVIDRDDRPRKHETGVIRLTDDPANDFWPRWGQDGRIGFYRMGSDKKGKNMSINPDGTDQMELSAGEYKHWSPDGTKFIFAKPGDKTARYLANADGSNEVTLPPIGNTDWTTDSKRIVYQLGTGEHRNSELFIYSLDTGRTENITNHPGFDADPSFSPDGKRIVFTSTRDGNAEIYLMNSDGSNVRRLTNHPAWDNHPVFSPDGTTIAFNGDREDENYDVFLMNIDGGDLRRLTTEKFDETVGPGCWSPDGTQIAYFAYADGNDDIFVTSAEVFRPQLVLADDTNELQFPSYSPDGRQIFFQAVLPDKTGELSTYDIQTEQVRVLAKTESGEIRPIISPDGSLIVFQDKIGSNTEICSMRTDGTELTNLTQNPAREMTPAFSPDGKRIAFVSNRDGSTASFFLYVMNADGSDQRRVHQKEGLVFSPAWFHDGGGIVFACDKVGIGNFDIYSVSPDDPESERQLTSQSRADMQPAISPDGKQIAFTSNADGDWEIYVMNSDGTGRLRLTRNPAADGSPHWSPDGSKIIFNSNRSGKFAIYTIDLSTS